MLLNFFCAVVVYRFRLSARWMIPKLNGSPIWLVSIALALVCAKVQAREGQPWPLHRVATQTVPGLADGHCIADVDGDGRFDMVVAHDIASPQGAITIHFHPGKKAIRGQWPSLCLSGMHTTEGVRTADFDGDGRPEVIAGNQAAALSLWFPPRDPKRVREAKGWQRIDLPDSCGRALEVQTLQIDGRHGPDIVAGRDHLWWLACPENPAIQMHGSSIRFLVPMTSQARA